MTRKGIKLAVTLPDGSTATRTTWHAYTHVLAVKGGMDDTWSAYSWHHDAYAAERALNALLNQVRRRGSVNAPGNRWYVDLDGMPRILEVEQAWARGRS